MCCPGLKFFAPLYDLFLHEVVGAAAVPDGSFPLHVSGFAVPEEDGFEVAVEQERAALVPAAAAEPLRAFLLAGKPVGGEAG
ncbi:putative hypothetical protein [Streptomyces sp. NBRC 110611]|nr:putative hypothetical protein [Streptomyces sp. NBRC 110611]